MNLFCLLVWGMMALGEGDWPQWRGPRGDGVSFEAGFAHRGQERWRCNVGIGYSACTLVGDRLYSMGHDASAGEDVVWCLDAESGEQHWQYRFPAEIRANFHGGGTLTTPAVEGDAVYVTQRDGRGICLAADSGVVRWQRNYAEELEQEIPIHGFPASPLLRDGQLLLTFGGVCLAASRADGSILWRTEPRPRGSYSSPTLFEHHGRSLLAWFAADGLVILERQDGSELAFHEFGTSDGVNASSPVVSGDRLFVSAGYNLGAKMLRLTGDGLEVLWETKRMRSKVQTCVLWDGHLFGFDESMLKCFDLEGNELWRKRGLGMGSLTAAEDALWICSSRGELIVAQASSEEYKELSREKVLDGGVYWTAPTLSRGRVYLRNSDGELVCRDHRDLGLAQAPDGARPLQEMPPATELLQGHARAVGGPEAWKQIQHMTVKGIANAVDAGLIDAETTLLFTAPGGFRRTVNMKEYGLQERGLTGGEQGFGWQTDPFSQPKVLEGEELALLEDEADFQRHVHWQQEYRSVRTRARVQFDGMDCWQVDAITQGDEPRSLYFSPTTGMLVGHESETEALVVYGEYAAYGSIRLPMQRRSLAPESGEEQSFRVETVSFETFGEQALAAPSEVQRLFLSPAELEAAQQRLTQLYGDLLGSYLSNFGNDYVPLLISRGRLALRFSEENVTELREPEEGDDRWFLGGGDAMWVRIQRDSSGQVVGLLVHTPDGGEYEWPRKTVE
jgi:hypothetical protein